LDPSYFFAYAVLGWNYERKGMYSEAASACRKALTLEPEEQVTLGSCGFLFGVAGMREEALALLARIKKVPERGYLDPYYVAWLYAGLGDTSNTMVCLERAYREHSASLWVFKAEIFPDGVRADPHFQDLLRRMKFPP
jgi:tetratricopeptide (TPR) repeat protein